MRIIQNAIRKIIPKHPLKMTGSLWGICLLVQTICLSCPEALPEPVYIESVYASWDNYLMPSVGEAGIPVFMVDFPDVAYRDTQVEPEELEKWIFKGEYSVASYYNVSSDGRLKIDGDIYYYTAEDPMEAYETGEALEALIQEVLAFFDDEVDFSQYDKNEDGYLDCLILSVPTGGNADFWWSAQHIWYANPEYEIDGVGLMRYIVNNEQPCPESRYYFVGALEHELGHCMGLPDYYKYEYTGTDYEGLHGYAGKERMDDSEGDFSQFSKLQLGWLATRDVRIMPDSADRATFYLPPVKDRGCLLIFPKGKKPDFQSEYFLVEYNTPEGLQKNLFSEGGVRVLHVQAEVMRDVYGYYDYKYSNYSPFYDTSNNGIRILKLVNDGKGFFQEGDIVTYENTGAEKGNFGWYTKDGGITEPGFQIRIGELNPYGLMEIEVIWDEM